MKKIEFPFFRIASNVSIHLMTKVFVHAFEFNIPNTVFLGERKREMKKIYCHDTDYQQS